MLIMAQVASEMPHENWQETTTEDMSRLANFYLYVINDTFLKIKATFYSDPHINKDD